MTTIIHLHIHPRAGAEPRPDPPEVADPADALSLRPCGPASARAMLRGFGVFAYLPAAEQRALWRHSAAILRAARRPAQALRHSGDDAA